MTQIEMVNAQIQRGLLRAVLTSDGIAVEQTREGSFVAKALTAGKPIRCIKCNGAYPKAGELPKYSVCPTCRKGTMPLVDFIERPQK